MYSHTLNHVLFQKKNGYSRHVSTPHIYLLPSSVAALFVSNLFLYYFNLHGVYNHQRQPQST